MPRFSRSIIYRNPVVFNRPISLLTTVRLTAVFAIALSACSRDATAPVHSGPVVGRDLSSGTNGAPVADAGAAQAGNEGSAVTFDASASTDPDGDAIASYTWDFGDGSQQTVSTPTVGHVYNDNKSGGNAYVVTLQVTDGSGATSAPATTSALIGNVAPTAVFAPPGSIGEGSMNLSLTGAQDALGDLSTLQYAVDCGNGAGYGSLGSSASISCVASDNGLWHVKAKVADKDGAQTEYSGAVSVTNVAPTITIISAPSSGSVGVDYTLQFKFTDPGIRDAPWFYQVNWGDRKKAGLDGAITQGLTIRQTHRFPTPGTYTITIRVVDKDGGIAASSVGVTVTR
ncbi:MAG: PKD domain-containing protein [Gemmatimonadaceae bacterium]